MNNRDQVKVWDLSIRLFHWLLATLVVFCWLSAELGGNWMIWHLRSGYLITGLLTYRILWGLVGSWSARFSQFIRPPSEIISYLRGKHPQRQFLSHNPLGGLGVIAMLCLLSAQVLSGLFSNDDIYIEGPLAHLISYDNQLAVTDLHKAIFNLILLLIATHILAVLYHQLHKGEALIAAMLHGRKEKQSRSAPPLRVPRKALLLCLSAGGAISATLLYLDLS